MGFLRGVQRKPSNRDPLYELPEYVGLLGRIAANVQRLRAERGWTQEEAAHQCREMAVLVYASVERAENNLTALTLTRLAMGFGVDVRDLLAPALAPKPRKPGRPRKAVADDHEQKHDADDGEEERSSKR